MIYDLRFIIISLWPLCLCGSNNSVSRCNSSLKEKLFEKTKPICCWANRRKLLYERILWQYTNLLRQKSKANQSRLGITYP